MDKISTYFISFFVGYVTVFFVVVIPLVVYYVYTVRVYYDKKDDRLMDELFKELIARRDAEREARCQRAEIERLAKKVATLEGELSALRANSSKQK
jgi:hypothetical protein|nr:MAG TPA: Mitochondrial Calcium Uniporter channel, mitochondria, pentamer, N-terminal [Caudoviricetes sp.]